MSSPVENDPTLARFRRGARPPAGSPGPPPVVPEYDAAAPEPLPSAPLPPAPLPLAGEPSPWAPRDVGVAGTPVEGRGWAEDPARPLFGELVADRDDEFDPPWTAVDDDPGRSLGITAVAIGLFVGVVGVFVGIASVRRSRLAGLAGVTGYVGIAVSVLSIVVFSAIGLSWLRYEISLAQQCSLVGPGQYLTQTGQQVSCG